MLSLNLLIIWMIGLACVRIGRMHGQPATVRVPRSVLAAGIESALRAVARRGGVYPA